MFGTDVQTGHNDHKKLAVKIIKSVHSCHVNITNIVRQAWSPRYTKTNRDRTLETVGHLKQNQTIRIHILQTQSHILSVNMTWRSGKLCPDRRSMWTATSLRWHSAESHCCHEQSTTPESCDHNSMQSTISYEMAKCRVAHLQRTL